MVTVKLFLESFEPTFVREAITTTMKELDTDFIEQLIIVFPQHSKYLDKNLEDARFEKMLKVWKESEKLVEEKTVLLLGVADFSKAELKKLCQNVKVLPRFDQVHQVIYEL